MTDFASVQKHLTSITTVQTDFAKSSFSRAYFEKLAGVKSPDKVIESRPNNRQPNVWLIWFRSQNRLN